MSNESLIGKHVLIGITYLDPDGHILEQTQLHGDIVGITDEVITVKLAGSGEEFTLPPDVEAFQKAPEGMYRLRSSGEQIVNPDLLTSWTVTKPSPEADSSHDAANL
jgi:hypothetical protein